MARKREKTDRVALNVRMRESLRLQIERAAQERDVSMNAEAVDRLERSFDRELRVSELFKEWRLVTLDSFGSEETYNVCRAIGLAIACIEKRTNKSFLSDEETNELASQVAYEVVRLVSDESRRELGEKGFDLLELIHDEMREAASRSDTDFAEETGKGRGYGKTA